MNRRMMFGRRRTRTELLLSWLVCSSWMLTATAILPTAEIVVSSSSSEDSHSSVFLASQANFGALLSQDDSTAYTLQHTDSLLCQNVTSITSNELFHDSIVLVPRGECTYQHKAFTAQQMGAKGIVIYNTLASRYTLNTTTTTTTTTATPDPQKTTTLSDIIFPQPFYDYDCQLLGSAEIPTSELQFTQEFQYDAQHNDPLLSGDGPQNLCRQHSPNQLANCPSKRCLLTNYTPTDATTKACCAWDLHLWLYGDDSDLNVQIPAVFVTMEQASQLSLLALKDTTIVLRARWKPTYNPSSFLVWLLGVLVAAVAAYQSAGDYHIGIAKLTKRLKQQRVSTQEGEEAQEEPLARRNPMQEETVELEPIHAIGFIAMASTSLFILFYFKVNTILYIVLMMVLLIQH